MAADLIVLAASFLQSSTGYGFSIIGTPFLLFMYPVHTAIQINIVLSICLSAFMIFKIRKEVDQTLLMRLIKGSGAGLVCGIFIYLFADIQLLKMLVGVLILMVTTLLVFQVTFIRTKNRDFAAGGFQDY
ncbi:hypothetical protein JNUCC1_01679 [Lentibacillus sp. JNUCC-1]|nr:hypothetical protein [Lentibacillus sp. JNUCC-1]